MKHYTIVGIKDAEGITGWAFKGMPIINTPMAALDGRLLAHDLLEHQNGFKAIGSLDDELIAFGGSWFVRGESGDVTTQGLGYDIANLGEYYARGINFRTDVPRTRPLSDDYAESQLKEAIRRGYRILLQELAYQGEEIDKPRLREFCVAALHYMRQGYRKATRRFRESDEANHLFNLIVAALTPYVKHEPEFIGERIRLTIDYQCLSATAELIESYY